jgi:hypothetical protein
MFVRCTTIKTRRYAFAKAMAPGMIQNDRQTEAAKAQKG